MHNDWKPLKIIENPSKLDPGTWLYHDYTIIVQSFVQSFVHRSQGMRTKTDVQMIV